MLMSELSNRVPCRGYRYNRSNSPRLELVCMIGNAQQDPAAGGRWGAPRSGAALHTRLQTPQSNRPCVTVRVQGIRAEDTR